jgi:xylan 1,4-beta-xylosidase
VISVINRFERRLSLFPAGVDKDGILYANTYAGDYPHWLPRKKFRKPADYFTGWMLLSYQKNTEASSSLVRFPSSQAVDENIKTHWSAQTNKNGEWLMVDLGQKSCIRAIQVNYAEHAASLYGRDAKDYHQYLLQYSKDKKNWKILVDKRNNTTSVPHDYLQLHRRVKARYIRLTNIYVPDNNFAISGFRIFGKAHISKPAFVKSFHANRNQTDPRRIVLTWPKVNGATGYIVRFGINPKKLYNSYMVYNREELELNCLNVGVKYYFAIDSFNEGGITQGKAVITN